jgi:outer membrane protein assembly factor BamB
MPRLRIKRHLETLLLAFAICGFSSFAEIGWAENWPQWRGPFLNGTSPENNLPSSWSKEENVLWKLKMPALSGSTPIVWGDRIFLNVADGKDLHLWALERTTGTVLWKGFLDDRNKKINKQNMSSPSPVTDGASVWVMTGTGVLKRFDFAGNELWARNIQDDYGKFGQMYGYGSSPLLYRDSLYVQVVHGKLTKEPSYVLCIDKATGETRWRVERQTEAVAAAADSYGSPMLLDGEGRAEIIVSGANVVTGYEPTTGRELWRADGLNPTNDPTNRTVASPVVMDGVIYAPARYGPLLAIKAGGRGDITQTHRLWGFDRGPEIPTPVTDGELFYTVNDNGIMWCLDAKTGEKVWGPRRIAPGTYSSSPVLADGKIYATNEDGITTVVQAGPVFEILAWNDLDEYCLSSPAISDGQIFIRTTQHLYCIGRRLGKSTER